MTESVLRCSMSRKSLKRCCRDAYCEFCTKFWEPDIWTLLRGVFVIPTYIRKWNIDFFVSFIFKLTDICAEHLCFKVTKVFYFFSRKKQYIIWIIMKIIQVHMCIFIYTVHVFFMPCGKSKICKWKAAKGRRWWGEGGGGLPSRVEWFCTYSDVWKATHSADQAIFKCEI